MASSALSRSATIQTGDIATEDIKDDVQIKVGPLDRPAQLANVPTPELIGTGGEQFGLLISRMDEMIATFARLCLLLEQAIHRADRA